jgi:CHAT domain-containing protein/cytochrome c-type biogenesis protein CcmH/NrfG
MPEQSQNKIELRKYLLGDTGLQVESEKIEEQLMLDDEYFKEFLRQEEELIQEYADKELAVDEEKAFEKHFLISDERRKKVAFAKALRKYVDGQPENVTEVKDKRNFWSIFKSFFSSPLPIAAGFAAVILTSFFVWYLYFRSSAADLAMNSLNKAYRNERPLAARITDFGYAPFYKTRSEKKENVDIDERDLAELSLRNEVKQRPTAENLHALGRLYLAKKDFDAAIEKLENAKALDSKNAEIFNDLGVAYLEKYKTQANDQNDKNSELTIQALDFFDKAIALNPKLLEAYFNRADCLQTSNLPNEAKEAWKKYLELDSTSQWAGEARQRLETLESKIPADISADELEKAFLRAFNEKNDDEAFRLTSQNREMIYEKYLPQRLAISLVNSAEPAGRAEKLEAMRYLGKLEKERIGDNFASDLADFYAKVSEDKIELLKKAHAAVRAGYEICLKTNKFGDAKVKFEIAREFFLQAGDVIEAKTISDYFIAYCFYDSDRLTADKMLKQIGEFSERKNYRWFALMNYYWWLGSQEHLGYKTITETRNEYENALQNARNMGDFYMMQKFLGSLLLKSSDFKQEKKTFSYLHQLLEISTEPNLSVRQKFRGFDKIIKILSTSPYGSFSNAVMSEIVSLAKTQTDPSFVIGYEINAGIVNTQVGNFEEAERWFFKARQEAENLPKESVRTASLTKVFLNLGHLEKKRKNLRQAADYYDNSLELSEKSSNLSLLYEIRKSRLLTSRALENDEEIERGIPSLIKLAEDYRKQITAEQERNSFFDNEQPVYDIAIEHEMRRERFEQAYEYAEDSSSRSLLDSMAKDAENNFSEPAMPLNLSQIRENMPPEVQILQFRVLENKVLIWLISKEKSLPFSSVIGSDELEEKVKNYLELIRANKPENKEAIAALSREFYSLLIEPALPFLDKSKQICLIPNKSLFRLPFSSFISPDEKYFLEEFTFFYSPSASVFIQCTKNAKIKAEIKEEKLLSVGNPAFDRRQFPDLEDLPESKTEALEIRKNYNKSEALIDREATKNSFLSLYKNFEIIHFAGHYIVEPDSPLLSKLIMAKNGENTNDGFLTNMELRDKNLPQTKLVVLSACQTGVEGAYNSEGLSGISRTFLASGVPLVVASAWQVESEATSTLMKKFHYYRQKKSFSTSQALRQSQLDMLKSADGRFQSIYFWAAFSVSGAYAEF